MKAIVAVDNEWGIGRANQLLFRQKQDMAHFKEQTKNATVVMGYNTFMSLPNQKPLQGRRNIVFTSKTLSKDTGVETVANNQQLRSKLAKDENVFLIGGAMLYQSLLPFCEQAIVTKVDACGGADAFFPNLDKSSDWEELSASEEREDGEYKIKFVVYKNKNQQEL
jgi:dihydrofolate reductase